MGPSDGATVLPILSGGEDHAHPPDRPARGVSLDIEGDDLTIRAEAAGWAWLRVPWDPDWHSLDGTPVRKGGPGHLVVWANRGLTRLRWAVPAAVDVAAVATTGAAALATAALALLHRRGGRTGDPDRRRPVTEAWETFAETLDGWIYAIGRRLRRSRS